MANPNNLQALATVTVAKETGAGPTYSTAQLDIVRYQDGTIEFTKTNGVVVRVPSGDIRLKELYDALDALV